MRDGPVVTGVVAGEEILFTPDSRHVGKPLDVADAVLVLLHEENLLLGQVVESFHVVAGEQQLRSLWVQLRVAEQIQQGRNQVGVHVRLHLVDYRDSPFSEDREEAS